VTFRHFHRAHHLAGRIEFGEAVFNQRRDDDISVGEHLETVEFGPAAEPADNAAAVRRIFRCRLYFAGAYNIERPQTRGVGFGDINGFAIGRKAAVVCDSNKISN